MDTIMTGKHEITRDDIMPMAEYAQQRRERARALSAIKRDRRVEVGPHATLYFENFDTMWHQIHEMLYIEKGGEEQIDGELAAYNPLIPKGRELVATFMITPLSDPLWRFLPLLDFTQFPQPVRNIVFRPPERFRL